ncbi:hypothetical protein PENSPDRAFT_694997 [Peniophora sp. CONT]|nr:hypothetical protein PENSPDRAFT_694997 [Peniophora sp. CONT]
MSILATLGPAISALCTAIETLVPTSTTTRNIPRTRTIPTATIDNIVSLGRALRTLANEHDNLPSPPTTPSPEFAALESKLDSLASKLDTIVAAAPPVPVQEPVAASSHIGDHVAPSSVSDRRRGRNGRDASLDIPPETHSPPLRAATTR